MYVVTLDMNEMCMAQVRLFPSPKKIVVSVKSAGAVQKGLGSVWQITWISTHINDLTC